MPSPPRSKKPAPTRARASASFERLRIYISARAAVTPAEFDIILPLFAPRRLDKGEVLQRAGEPARHVVFVAEGCLRSFVIDNKGKVHITGFAPEDWWLSDSARFLDGGPSTLFIDAIEATDVLLIDHASHQRMLDTVPAIAAAYRVGLQRLAAARDQRIIASLSGSAPERYQDFAARYPTLLRRVPSRMLASYLWMSPETLKAGPRSDESRFLSGHPEGSSLGPPPRLGGGRWVAASSWDTTAWSGPWGVSYSANLTSDENTGIGSWSEDTFVRALRTGRHMGASRPILPPMPWGAFRNLSDEDLRSIHAYLMTVPPIRNRVPEPLPPPPSPPN